MARYNLALFVGLAFFIVSEGVQFTKIHPALLSTLANSDDVKIIINFAGNNENALKHIENRSFPSRGDKITALKQSLEEHAFRSQKSVQEYLRSEALPFNSYWISNQMVVKASSKIVQALASFPEVESIHQEARIIFPAVTKNKNSFASRGDQGYLWNLRIIEAREAWKISNGSGIVAGIIDTGVLHTHEALKDTFRGIEYGWYQPANKEPIPYDWVNRLIRNFKIILNII